MLTTHSVREAQQTHLPHHRQAHKADLRHANAIAATVKFGPKKSTSNQYQPHCHRAHNARTYFLGAASGAAACAATSMCLRCVLLNSGRADGCADCTGARGRKAARLDECGRRLNAWKLDWHCFCRALGACSIALGRGYVQTTLKVDDGLMML